MQFSASVVLTITLPWPWPLTFTDMPTISATLFSVVLWGKTHFLIQCRVHIFCCFFFSNKAFVSCLCNQGMILVNASGSSVCKFWWIGGSFKTHTIFWHNQMRWHCQVQEQLEAARCVCPLLQNSHTTKYKRTQYCIDLEVFDMFFFSLAKHIGCISSATVCVRTINETLPLWMSSPLSPPPTVSSGGQPHQAGDGHHGSAGVMRERRAAGDPYWSYSGEPPFMLRNGLRSLSRRGNMCEIQIYWRTKRRDCGHHSLPQRWTIKHISLVLSFNC